MATTVNITSNFAGKAAADFVLPAFKSGDTLANKTVTIQERIAYKWNLRKMSSDAALADATCDFTPTNTLDFTEVVLQPKELQINEVLCKGDFVQMWDAEEVMRGGANNKKLAAAVGRAASEYLASIIADNVEDYIWHGTNGARQFEGFVTRALADATVIDLTGPAISADPTADGVAAIYVINALQNVIDALPKSIYRKSDLNIYIPRDVHAAYTRVLGGFGTAGVGAAGINAQGFFGEKQMNYNGFNLVYTPGLLDGNIVATRKSNLVFGTSLISDLNSLKIIDTSDILADDNVRIAARLTAGTQIVYGNEVVLAQYTA